MQPTATHSHSTPRLVSLRYTTYLLRSTEQRHSLVMSGALQLLLQLLDFRFGHPDPGKDRLQILALLQLSHGQNVLFLFQTGSESPQRSPLQQTLQVVRLRHSSYIFHLKIEKKFQNIIFFSQLIGSSLGTQTPLNTLPSYTILLCPWSVSRYFRLEVYK